MGKVKEDKGHFENAFLLVFPEEPKALAPGFRLGREEKSDFAKSVGMPLSGENMLFSSRFGEALRITEKCQEWLNADLVHLKTLIESEQVHESYRKVGSLEAEPHCKQSLETFNKVSAGLNALVRAMQYESEPPNSKALEIAEEDVGLHSREVKYLLRGRRACRLQKEGQLDKAEVLFREILEDKIEVRGPCDPEVATALQNLAFNLRYQGRDTEAEPIFWRAWEIRVEALGPENRDTASSLLHLGYVLQALGRHAEAETFLREGLEVMERIDAQQEDTALAAKLLAHLLNFEGRFEEAEPFAKQALEIMERGLGSDHPNVVQYRELYDDPRLAPYKRLRQQR